MFSLILALCLLPASRVWTTTTTTTTTCNTIRVRTHTCALYVPPHGIKQHNTFTHRNRLDLPAHFPTPASFQRLKQTYRTQDRLID
ncbi:uncharacterized protein F4812DRAFT_416386 [Daldinia caldariorum]|uniref:uncharacterized protein n=1 Tax=Daldinia caldariorum TaxID=326644 RepID=UPI002007DB61|nr:uncharacterized protein F4812DRAFT_416386 [Daldinia caldariorum]KAI1472017.1 hypothetical protein F4812DRAFT_416386 [Daldinia caldariorum]